VGFWVRSLNQNSIIQTDHNVVCNLERLSLLEQHKSSPDILIMTS
jgi:hypothetical protein